MSFSIFTVAFNFRFCLKVKICLYRRTVKDPQTGQDVILSDNDVDLIRRLESQKIPDEAFDEYAVSVFKILKLFHVIFVLSFLFSL